MPTSRSLACLAALALASAAPAAAAQPAALRCGRGVERTAAPGFEAFPEGQVFCPLVADPKATRSFLSYLRGEFPRVTAARDVGSVGIGDAVGLLRWGGRRPGDGLQLGIDAGIFAQFDLGSQSADLINADYVVGLPLTFRRGGFSGRVRVYHQSSHLGDEFLDRTEIVNEGLSFEAAEILLSQEVGPLRVYGGGEVLFGRRPSTLDASIAHGGAELRLGRVRGPRFVAAMDVKSSEQRRWDAGWSFRMGLEMAHWTTADRSPRLWSLLGEVYDGPSPYGQFFLESTRFYGFGFHFLL
jgi:hypothetical protein